MWRPQNGLLIGSVGIFGNVIRVAPPLVITEAEAHESLDIFEKSLSPLYEPDDSDAVSDLRAAVDAVRADPSGSCAT